MTHNISMVFIETPIFTEDLLKLLSEDEYKEMQKTLLYEPETGDLLSDLYLQEICSRRSYSRSNKAIEVACKRSIKMKDKDFNRLVEGVKQFVQIKRGEIKPSRVFEFTAPDVKALRESLHKSQSEFAKMIGVSLSTLQNWEQGRRKPVGPAQALLKVVQLQPDAVLKALSV